MVIREVFDEYVCNLYCTYQEIRFIDGIIARW